MGRLATNEDTIENWNSNPANNFCVMQTSQYHAFSLPPSLLTALKPRELVGQVPQRTSSPAPTVAPSTSSGVRTCNICLSARFGDVEEQRVHFRSDWHRYNVKMRLNGAGSVSEAAFNALIDGMHSLLILIMYPHSLRRTRRFDFWICVILLRGRRIGCGRNTREQDKTWCSGAFPDRSNTPSTSDSPCLVSFPPIHTNRCL